MTKKTKAAETEAPAQKPVKADPKPRRSEARLKELERMGLDPRPYGLTRD